MLLRTARYARHVRVSCHVTPTVISRNFSDTPSSTVVPTTKVLTVAKTEIENFGSHTEVSPAFTPRIETLVKVVKAIPVTSSVRVPAAVEHESSLSSHKYVYAAKLGSLEDIATKTGYSRKQLLKLINDPYFFMDMWFLNVPFGGAQFIKNPPVQVAPKGVVAQLNLMGATEFPFTDPIQVSHAQTTPFFNQSFGLITADDVQSSLADTLQHSFLASTLWGHALPGAVSHNFLIYEDILYGMWFGTGRGLPILGGSFNNVVACNSLIGTWAQMARNMNETLEMKMYWEFLTELQRCTTPEAKVALLMKAARTLESQRSWMSWTANKLGTVHTSAGAPVRLGSKGYGEVLRFMAYLKGREHSDVKY
ncbi:hypothetical protein [Stigmatella erecta]|uniref:Uncharacterized protein n=1 Tax=Stigmatella erecta TaxID=83460 RepID=A0A1I0IP12_9BACT|nr:hypothetical protein [Stigmatella erecta]SET98095.1 hypothetical protein SAMN05443639_106150 [Stigmatella erecta]